MKIQKRYQFLIFLGILILTAQIAFRIYVLCNSKDIPPIDDSDLILVRPDIPHDQNAYPIFIAATNFLFYPEELELKGDYLWSDEYSEEIDITQVAEVIKRNKKLYEVIHSGLKYDHCFREIKGLMTIPAREWNQFSTVTLTKSKSDIEQGDIDEALNTLIALLHFGYIISRDAEFIVEHTVGCTILGQSLSYIQEIALYEDLSTERAKELIAELEKITDLRSGYINGVKDVHAVNEDLFALQQKKKTQGFTKILQIVTGTSRMDYLFKPNKTKMALTEMTRNTIKQARLPYSALTPQPECVKLPSTPLARKLFFMQENSIGRMLIGLNDIVNANIILDESYRTETRANATKLIFALTLYKREHNRLPEALDQLVPEYLPSIPLDPYDGNPFRYSKKNRTVYSVGKNLQDSGGEFIKDNSSRQTCCGDEETGHIYLIHR